MWKKGGVNLVFTRERRLMFLLYLEMKTPVAAAIMHFIFENNIKVAQISA